MFFPQAVCDFVCVSKLLNQFLSVLFHTHVVCEHMSVLSFISKNGFWVCFFIHGCICVCVHFQTMSLKCVSFFYFWFFFSFLLLSQSLFLSSIKLKKNSQRAAQPVSSWCSQTAVMCWLGNKNRYVGIETSVSQCAESLDQTASLCVFPTWRVSVPLLGSLWRVQ